MYPRPAGQVLRLPWQLLGRADISRRPLRAFIDTFSASPSIGNGNASALGFNDLTGDMSRLLEHNQVTTEDTFSGAK